MKKYLALLAAMLFVLSFAAIAFAQTPTGTQAVVSQGDTQINLSGEIGMRGRYFKNLDLNKHQTDTSGEHGSSNQLGNASFYQYHYALKIEATTGKVKGVMELYSGKTGWLTWGSNSFQNPVEDDAAQTGSTGYGPNWRQLYIAFPIGPVTATIGHQLLQLGVASFFDATKEGADAILLTYKFDKNLIGLGTIKAAESNYSATVNSGYDNDLNIYFALGNFDLAGNTLGINLAQVRNGLTTGANDPDTLYNAGLTFKAKAGPVGILLAGDKQFGDNGNDATKVKYKGWHARGVFDFSATDMIKLTAASIYYSGDNGNTDKKNEKFVTYLEDKDYATFVFGYMIRNAIGANAPLATTQYGPGVPVPGGYWFNRLAIDVKPTKDLNAQLAYINIRGTYKNQSTTTSKKVGDEVDLKVDYSIAKNLTYTIQGGYFMPGKAWERTGYKNEDNAIAVQHVVMYNF